MQTHANLYFVYYVKYENDHDNETTSLFKRKDILKFGYKVPVFLFNSFDPI